MGGEKEAVSGFDSKDAIETQMEALRSLELTYTMKAQVKVKQLKTDVDAILAKLEATPVNKEGGITNAALNFWRGKALSSLVEHSKEHSKDAEAALQKAIKLEPKMIKAWNCLGQCYWKRGDFKSAKTCFLSAIKQAPNTESYRDLSMILRSQKAGSTQAERAENLGVSIKYARDALALDTKDGESWYVLGNALLTQFLGGSGHSTLKKTLKAYQMAEKLQGETATNPDLYFNRGNVFKFHEDYAEAVDNYKRALELDPSLPAEGEIEGIRRLISKLSNLVATKNKMKQKKLDTLTRSMPDPEKWKGKGTLVMTKELDEGVNQDKAVIVKLVAPVNKDTGVPVSLVAMDRAQNMVVVSLYNIASQVTNFFKVNDILVIHSPVLKRISLEDFSYPTIQILDPGSFLLNGKQLAKEQHALPETVNECM